MAFKVTLARNSGAWTPPVAPWVELTAFGARLRTSAQSIFGSSDNSGSNSDRPTPTGSNQGNKETSPPNPDNKVEDIETVKSGVMEF